MSIWKEKYLLESLEKYVDDNWEEIPKENLDNLLRAIDEVKDLILAKAEKKGEQK